MSRHTPGKMMATETRLWFPSDMPGNAGGVDFKHAPNGADDAKRAAKCWNEYDGLVEALHQAAMDVEAIRSALPAADRGMASTTIDRIHGALLRAGEELAS